MRRWFPGGGAALAPLPCLRHASCGPAGEREATGDPRLHNGDPISTFTLLQIQKRFESLHWSVYHCNPRAQSLSRWGKHWRNGAAGRGRRANGALDGFGAAIGCATLESKSERRQCGARQRNISPTFAESCDSFLTFPRPAPRSLPSRW